MHILALTHTGMTTDQFAQDVRNWMAVATHPRFDRRYDQLTYEPQQQLLEYLRANGFRTYIVSGGGADFMRVFSQRVYGIPPEQVVGSTGTVKYELRDGKPVLIKTADYVFVDDKAGKPAGIHEFIGRRPILAVGNSDGDQAMLEYTTIDNPHPSLGVLIHHTDAEREYAYDAHPPASGTLVTALQQAGPRVDGGRYEVRLEYGLRRQTMRLVDPAHPPSRKAPLVWALAAAIPWCSRCRTADLDRARCRCCGCTDWRRW